MRLRNLILAGLLALPLPLLGWGSARLADRFAGALAGGLHDVGSRVLAPSPAPRADAQSARPAPRLDEQQRGSRSVEPPPAVERAASPRKRGFAAPRPVAPRRGIRVSAGSVLRLAGSGAMPSGRYVPASGARPAGLALSGVSALGIGLQDGDVLTHAGGRPALSRADVIGVVIAARGAGATEIGGRFWRDGEPWNLIVEQPYTGGNAAPATPHALARR